MVWSDSGTQHEVNLQGIDLRTLDLLSDQVKVRGKGRKERIVPVGHKAVQALRRYLLAREAVARKPGADRAAVFLNRSGRRLGVTTIQRRMHRLFDGIAASGHRVHSLRHTFATRLAEDGANASEIMRLLGHASLTTSQNYIEVTAAQQRAAVRANRTNRALGRLS